MRIRIYGLILIILTTIVYACEEIIEIDLNEANPELVIEAIISKDSTAIVRITKTTSYFSHAQPELIPDAIVSINRDNIETEELVYQEDGYYNGILISGQEDSIYQIEVIYEGNTYSSSAYMPPATEIISIIASESTFGGQPGENEIYELKCNFIERPNVPDYFMIKYIQNGILLDDFYSLTSDFNAMDSIISYSGGMYLFEQDDTVEIQVFSIDENVYKYFSQMNDANGGMNMFSTPYNPRTNIDNAILGYFAAWSYVSETIVIQ